MEINVVIIFFIEGLYSSNENIIYSSFDDDIDGSPCLQGHACDGWIKVFSRSQHTSGFQSNSSLDFFLQYCYRAILIRGHYLLM